MAEYALLIKPSAQKELDALDEGGFVRLDGKILALAAHPRPGRMQEAEGL